MTEWNVPVISLFTGLIIRWEVSDGAYVKPHQTLCIIKPDTAIDDKREVFSPARGYLTIIKPYNEPGRKIWAKRTVIGEIQRIRTDMA